jgi:hypothetical protein
MVRTLLIRGMLVGLLAGSLAFGFGKVFGEPQVDRAISFETAMDEAKAKAAEAKGIHVEEEPQLVSRPDGRAAQLSSRAMSALLAACGFIAVYVVPNLKYPANPPSVGQPETIGQRTALYFIMLGLSVAAMVIATAMRKRLATRHGSWNAALVSMAFYLVMVRAGASLLPSINEVPAEFPAVVLWQFRMASAGMQLIMWSTFGLVFGVVAEHALRSERRLIATRRRHMPYAT